MMNKLSLGSVRSILILKIVAVISMVVLGTFSSVSAGQKMDLYMAVNNDAGTSHTIEVVGTDGSNRRVLLTRTLPVGDLKVDSENGKIFWLEDCGGNKMNLNSADIDGDTNSILEYAGGQVIGAASSIDIDPVNQRVYWMESSYNKIKSREYDKSNATVLHWDAALEPIPYDPNPMGFAYDVATSRFFYGRYATTNGAVFELVTTDINGSNIVVLADGSRGVGIKAIDFHVASNTVFFTRRQTSSSIKVSKTDMDVHELNYLDLPGTLSANYLRGIAVDEYNDLIYYSSIDDNKIMVSDFYGSGVTTFLSVGVENVYGLDLAPTPIAGTVILVQ